MAAHDHENMDDDRLVFADELPQQDVECALDPWKLMIVDDDEEVHNITKLALDNYSFEKCPVKFFSAYSGVEARQLIHRLPDTAVILLDVVMETEHAGLDVVKYIREELKNTFVRIILRTGHPGQAPEKKVITEYDINDYHQKSELTARKLFTSITSALRSYRDLKIIQKSYKEILANNERMKILLDVATSLSRTLDLDELMKNIISKISEILDAQQTSLFLLDRDTDEFWSKTFDRDEQLEIRFPADRGLIGQVAASGRVINVDDVSADPRFSPENDITIGYSTKNVLCVPVFNRVGDIIGVTRTRNKQNGSFDQRDIDLLKALSSQMAMALENAQLYDRTLSMKNYLESIHESISNCILTLDNDFNIVTANRSAIALFGKTDTELLQKDIRQIFGKANQELTRHITEVYTSQRPVIDYDVSGFFNRKTHSLNLNFVPLIDDKNDCRGQVLVFEDITREKRIKSTLYRYMAKDIVEKVLDDDPDHQLLGGARGRASILFADIRRFTGIAETLTPEETVAFLNEYFTMMVDVILKHGGILDKFIGDSLMAVFGVPYAREDDPVRAVGGALKMISALESFNEKRKANGQIPIDIGIGICTDEVLFGNIGSEKQMDFTVIGDGVNTSSRLESLNKQYGTKILINEETNRIIKDRFVTRMIDHVMVIGKTHPIRIFEVLGEKGYRLSPAEKFFLKGLDFYQTSDFQNAAALFEKGGSTDIPCRIFFERCMDLIRTPIEKEWDGIWISRQK